MRVTRVYGNTGRRIPPSVRALKVIRRAKKLNRRQRAEVKAIVSRRIEPKKFDTIAAAAQVDRGAIIAQLTAIPQGNPQSDRVGDEAYLKSLELYFNCWYVIGATQSQHAFRCIVFRWNVDTSLAAPSLGSIIQGSATINDINSPYDWNAKRQGDFTILLDKTFSVGSTSSGVIRRYRIPVKRRITFDPGATTGEGHLYVLFIGDDGTGAHTPDLQLQYQTRVVYTDS